MFRFLRTYIGDTFISETNSHIRECKLYHIGDESGSVGQFYSGKNFSFFACGKDKYRIEYIPRLRKPAYHLVHAHSDLKIGRYKIPNAEWLYLKDSFIYLNEYAPLKMAQNTSHRRLFNSATLRHYTFELTNHELRIIYKGEMNPNVRVGHVSQDQVFEGTIETSDTEALLPLFAGIHIIEEDFRRIESMSDL